MRICRGSSLVCVFILVIRSETNHNKGVRGRVVDLCKPTQRKYETAVSVILGRNVDAVVVDHEKTAIECIEVTNFTLMTIDYIKCFFTVHA